MQSDQSIREPKEDKFGRGMFVSAVADQISRIHSDSKECFIIGLYGRWGCGKTSVIGLLQRELTQERPERYYFTTYFNPWRYKSEDVLLMELFNVILKGARFNDFSKSNTKRLGKFLSKYAQYVVVPAIVIGTGFKFDVSKAVQGVLHGIGKLLDPELSLEFYKGKINEMMASLAKPLVIFIDDIDRLENHEIQSLFRLVKLTADFKNIIYVLAFDEEMVAKSIGKNFGSGSAQEGSAFLEKLVQLPLRMPDISRANLYRYFLELIDEWISENNIKLDEDEIPGFEQVLRGFHYFFVDTPRDCKRLLNAISFSASCLAYEVNIIDLILMEAIRVFTPEVFQFLVKNTWLFTHLPNSESSIINTRVAFRRRENDDTKPIDYFVLSTNLTEAEQSCIENVICYLFPRNRVFNRQPNEIPTQVKNRQRLFQYEYLSKYLEFRVGDQYIKDRLFDEIFDRLNDLDFDDLDNDIQTLINHDRNSVYGKLTNRVENLSPKGKTNLAKILGGELHFYEYDSPWADIRKSVDHFILQLIHKLESRTEVIRHIIENRETPQSTAHFLMKCLYGYKNLANQEEDIRIEREDLDPLIEYFVDKTFNQPIDRLFENVDENKNDQLFKLVSEFNRTEKLQAVLKGYFNASPRHALKYLKSMIRMTENPISNVRFYPLEIEPRWFLISEYYAKRAELIGGLRRLYPDHERLLAIPDLDSADLNQDERIVAEYLQFVSRDENPTY